MSQIISGSAMISERPATEGYPQATQIRCHGAHAPSLQLPIPAER